MTVPDAVIVQQSEWWNVLEALGPLATLLAAAVAGFIAWQALKERSLADRRSEWWSRAQWALDASLSADMERKATGLGVLALLAKSHLATEEEIEILATAAIGLIIGFTEFPDTFTASPSFATAASAYSASMPRANSSVERAASVSSRRRM